MQQIISPFQLFVDPSGQPIENGSVYIGPINVNPAVSQIAVYWDEAGTIPAAQPLKVSGGLFVRNGTPTRVYFGASDYSMSLYDAKNALVYYLPSVTSQATIYTDLAASTGAGLIGWIRNAVGAVFRWVSDKLSERVSVFDFMTSAQIADVQARTFLVDVTAALNSAIAYEQTNKRGLVFPGGGYLVSSTLNFLGNAYRDLTFVADGRVEIRSNAGGIVATLDAEPVFGAPTGSRADNIQMLGNWLFSGNAASTYGLFMRGLTKSNIQARASNIATAGFHIEWGVLTDYDLTCSDNVDTFTVTPQYGLQLTYSANPGNYPADCSFNLRMETASILGVDYMYGGLGNKFYGTCEGIPRGFRQRSTASDAVLIGVDFEANTVYDVSVEGRGLTFLECNSASGAVTSPNIMITSTAAQVKFIGCVYLRWVDVDAAAKNITMSQCAIADSGSVGLTGAGKGNIKTFGCCYVDGLSNWSSDIVGQAGISGTWTPSFGAGGGTQGAVTKAVGTYFTVGKLVFVQGLMTIAKGTLSAGAVYIAGLPIASRATTDDYQYINVGEWNTLVLGAGYTNLTLRIAPSSFTAVLIKSGQSVPSAVVNPADFPDPMNLNFSGVYEAL